ncbi:restriction endonuclease [Nodosilinea sp. FACHB-131]|uniref:restriction endonuclease n=2 Tax=Cyanophyceae TaxID=3028117 RepID=UPI001685C18A|nr:restriction endonuclease [Nodosilinea sp. FACHB-131]MBD1876723.1 restriction endonuclease [Nodosilinea sp. FACHB-131]
MTVQEIYEKIIELDLFIFDTPNPLQIVRKAIRRHCEGIEFNDAAKDKYFVYLENGRYWLRNEGVKGAAGEKKLHPKAHESKELDEVAIELNNLHARYISILRYSLLEKIRALDFREFEIFSKKLLEAYGFIDMKVTSTGKDGGIDGHGRIKVGMTYLRVAFQSKRWRKTSVGRKEISQFRGDIQGKFEQGYFFTTSTFTRGGEDVSFQPGAVPIIMFDGNAIVDIMINKEIGIEAKSKNLLVYEDAFDLLISGDSQIDLFEA